MSSAPTTPKRVKADSLPIQLSAEKTQHESIVPATNDAGGGILESTPSSCVPPSNAAVEVVGREGEEKTSTDTQQNLSLTGRENSEEPTSAGVEAHATPPAVAASLSLGASDPKADHVVIHAINVGTGDAAFFEFKDNTKKTIALHAIDAGVSDDAHNYFNANFAGQAINVAIVTHWDTDHHVGFRGFADNNNLQGTQVLAPKANGKLTQGAVIITQNKLSWNKNTDPINNPSDFVSKCDFAVSEATADADAADSVRYRCLAANMSYVNGVSAALVPGGASYQSNGSSIALLVERGSTRYYTAGDLLGVQEKEVASYLAAEAVTKKSNDPSYEKPLTGMKVSHHGSHESTPAELIAALEPCFAFISHGTRHGHPRDDTLKTLVDAQSVNRVYVTCGSAVNVAPRLRPLEYHSADDACIPVHNQMVGVAEHCKKTCDTAIQLLRGINDNILTADVADENAKPSLYKKARADFAELEKSLDAVGTDMNRAESYYTGAYVVPKNLGVSTAASAQEISELVKRFWVKCGDVRDEGKKLIDEVADAMEIEDGVDATATVHVFPAADTFQQAVDLLGTSIPKKAVRQVLEAHPKIVLIASPSGGSYKMTMSAKSIQIRYSAAVINASHGVVDGASVSVCDSYRPGWLVKKEMDEFKGADSLRMLAASGLNVKVGDVLPFPWKAWMDAHISPWVRPLMRLDSPRRDGDVLVAKWLGNDVELTLDGSVVTWERTGGLAVSLRALIESALNFEIPPALENLVYGSGASKSSAGVLDFTVCPSSVRFQHDLSASRPSLLTVDFEHEIGWSLGPVALDNVGFTVSLIATAELNSVSFEMRALTRIAGVGVLISIVPDPDVTSVAITFSNLSILSLVNFVSGDAPAHVSTDEAAGGGGGGVEGLNAKILKTLDAKESGADFALTAMNLQFISKNASLISAGAEFLLTLTDQLKIGFSVLYNVPAKALSLGGALVSPVPFIHVLDFLGIGTALKAVGGGGLYTSLESLNIIINKLHAEVLLKKSVAQEGGGVWGLQTVGFFFEIVLEDPNSADSGKSREWSIAGLTFAMKNIAVEFHRERDVGSSASISICCVLNGIDVVISLTYEKGEMTLAVVAQKASLGALVAGLQCGDVTTATFETCSLALTAGSGGDFSFGIEAAFDQIPLGDSGCVLYKPTLKAALARSEGVFSAIFSGSVWASIPVQRDANTGALEVLELEVVVELGMADGKFFASLFGEWGGVRPSAGLLPAKSALYQPLEEVRLGVDGLYLTNAAVKFEISATGVSVGLKGAMAYISSKAGNGTSTRSLAINGTAAVVIQWKGGLAFSFIFAINFSGFTLDDIMFLVLKVPQPDAVLASIGIVPLKLGDIEANIPPRSTSDVNTLIAKANRVVPASLPIPSASECVVYIPSDGSGDSVITDGNLRKGSWVPPNTTLIQDNTNFLTYKLGGGNGNASSSSTTLMVQKYVSLYISTIAEEYKLGGVTFKPGFKFTGTITLLDFSVEADISVGERGLYASVVFPNQLDILGILTISSYESGSSKGPRFLIDTVANTYLLNAYINVLGGLFSVGVDFRYTASTIEAWAGLQLMGFMTADLYLKVNKANGGLSVQDINLNIQVGSIAQIVREVSNKWARVVDERGRGATSSIREAQNSVAGARREVEGLDNDIRDTQRDIDNLSWYEFHLYAWYGSKIAGLWTARNVAWGVLVAVEETLSLAGDVVIVGTNITARALEAAGGLLSVLLGGVEWCFTLHRLHFRYASGGGTKASFDITGEVTICGTHKDLRLGGSIPSSASELLDLLMGVQPPPNFTLLTSAEGAEEGRTEHGAPRLLGAGDDATAALSSVITAFSAVQDFVRGQIAETDLLRADISALIDILTTSEADNNTSDRDDNTPSLGDIYATAVAEMRAVLAQDYRVEMEDKLSRMEKMLHMIPDVCDVANECQAAIHSAQVDSEAKSSGALGDAAPQADHRTPPPPVFNTSALRSLLAPQQEGVVRAELVTAESQDGSITSFVAFAEKVSVFCESKKTGLKAHHPSEADLQFIGRLTALATKGTAEATRRIGYHALAKAYRALALRYPVKKGGSEKEEENAEEAAAVDVVNFADAALAAVAAGESLRQSFINKVQRLRPNTG